MSNQKSRRPNGLGSAPRQLKDGRWRAELMVGSEATGARVRKYVYGRTRQECANKLKQTLADQQAGTLTTGRAPRFIDWVDYWLKNTPDSRIRPRTRREYASKIDNHVRHTSVARVRLDKLGPQHLEKIYQGMRDKGLSESTVTGCHRILARALKVAVQRKLIGVSPATQMDAPQQAPYRPQTISVADAKRLIAAAQADEEYGASWLVALVVGLRQGERLGLDEDDFDPTTGRLEVNRALFTMPWQHGCELGEDGGPSCGRKKGDRCPERRDGGTFTGPPKSEAGRRANFLPSPVAKALSAHIERQRAAREAAGAKWKGYTDQSGRKYNLIFSRANGAPLSGKQDWVLWRAFLDKAGVPAVRVHDARHTAATTLLALGVDPRIVMEMMGWSQQAMLQRYQHVLDEMKQDVATRIEGALFAPEEPAPDPEPSVVSLDAFRARKQA